MTTAKSAARKTNNGILDIFLPLVGSGIAGEAGKAASGDETAQENFKTMGNIIAEAATGKVAGDAGSKADPWIKKNLTGIVDSLAPFIGTGASGIVSKVVTGTDQNAYNSQNNDPAVTSAYTGSSASDNTKASGYGIDYLLQQMQAMQDKNNAWNAEQAEKQMQFQERMARNAHTYEVEDLKRAGLNPVLSAGAGNGAAAPVGASATADTSMSGDILSLAMMSIDAMANTAQAFASSGRGKGLGAWFNDPNTQKSIKNIGNAASAAASVAKLFAAFAG